MIKAALHRGTLQSPYDVEPVAVVGGGENNPMMKGMADVLAREVPKSELVQVRGLQLKQLKQSCTYRTIGTHACRCLAAQAGAAYV